MKCPCCAQEVHVLGVVFDSAGCAYWLGEKLRLTPQQNRVFKVMWDHDFVGHGTVTRRSVNRKQMPLSVAVWHIRQELKRLKIPLVIRTAPKEGYVLQPLLTAQ